MSSVTETICLSKRRAQQILQHPLDGPCPQCRVLRNGNGRHSGCWLCETPYGGLLLRRLGSCEHLLRTPPGVAFEESIWLQARGHIALIAVVDRASPSVWWTLPATFEDEATEIDRGHGPQLALPLGRWTHAMVLSDDPAEGSKP